RRPAPAPGTAARNMTAPVKEGGPDLDAGLLRSTASITIGNVASRVTGFVRVLAVGAALGTTFLGNTYQTSNLVSNILFELLAAGLLSSVLVPTFVGLVDDGRRDDAERVAGAVLGVCLVALGVILFAGIVLRPWVMRVLTVAVSDSGFRRHDCGAVGRRLASGSALATPMGSTEPGRAGPRSPGGVGGGVPGAQPALDRRDPRAGQPGGRWGRRVPDRLHVLPVAVRRPRPADHDDSLPALVLGRTG